MQSDPKVSYTDSGSGFIEIRTRQTEKSIIIEELRCRFPKDCAQKGKILAIGDNENDVDLFKLADISVAVANSSTLAKKQPIIYVKENAQKAIWICSEL